MATHAIVPVQQPQVPSFTMSDMERVANAIAQGGLFGSKDPFAVLTLCMLAQAEGQHPAVVFRDYHMISGKPSKKAEAMQRDFLMAGGKIEWHKLTDDECEATFSHPQGGTATISWDKARVAQAQLGGNAMHKKYPRQMLRARVISEGVRTVFPAATSGLYETGEVQDMLVQDAPSPTPSVPQPQRARDLKRVEPAAAAITDTGRAKAEEWVEGHLAAIADASDADALDAIIASGAKAVAKLQRDHADLAETVASALQRKADELQQGRPDTAHDGTLAEILDHIERKVTVIDVNSLVSSHKETIMGMDEGDRERIAEAQAARIAAIKTGAAQ